MPPSRLRVAMVCPRFAPSTGGTETHVAELSKRLVDRDIDVEILTTDLDGALAAEGVAGRVPVHRRRVRPLGGDHFFAPGIARMIQRTRYDLVHMQGVHSLLAPLTMAAARRSRLPYVVTFHTGGHHSATRRRLRGLQWRALAPMLRGASALIAVSQFERELFAVAIGESTDRIHLIPNGAELPSVGPEVVEDPNLILSVGRLEWYKGHHRAIAAMAPLSRLRPLARLIILGDGPERVRLLELAERLGVGDRVSIESVPPADRAAMATRLSSAGMVVLLSEYEAHPIAVTEALGRGRRVLVATTSGLREIVAAGRAAGISIDAEPEEIASEMHRVLGGPHPPAIMNLPSWDDCADAVAETYRSLVSG